VGQAFLQLARYDRIPKESIPPFFEALGQYYAPVLLKAPGLISYERFRHFDLPFILDLQL
jgi:hypothetical protein